MRYKVKAFKWRRGELLYEHYFFFYMEDAKKFAQEIESEFVRIYDFITEELVHEIVNSQDHYDSYA